MGVTFCYLLYGKICVLSDKNPVNDIYDIVKEDNKFDDSNYITLENLFGIIKEDDNCSLIKDEISNGMKTQITNIIRNLKDLNIDLTNFDYFSPFELDFSSDILTNREKFLLHIIYDLNFLIRKMLHENSNQKITLTKLLNKLYNIKSKFKDLEDSLKHKDQKDLEESNKQVSSKKNNEEEKKSSDLENLIKKKILNNLIDKHQLSHQSHRQI